MSTPTRLYVRADASRMDAEAVDILDDNVTLSASFDEAPGVRPVSDEGKPFEVLASEQGILVAEVTEPTQTTLHLGLSVDVAVGNEVADLVTHIPWEIVVEEDVPLPDNGGDDGPGGLAATSDPLAAGAALSVAVAGGSVPLASCALACRKED